VTWALRGAGLAVVAVVLAAAAFVVAASAKTAQPVTQATIAIHFSHFQTEDVTVPVATPVTFVLDNQDPIEHEWIVGDAATHERHRTGTEPYHDQVPTEVTIPALTKKTTVVTFARTGDFQFICHLPGHEEYGMKGTVHVVDPA
jgi:uncharacterized cupredoxin-like copper-binding protein